MVTGMSRSRVPRVPPFGRASSPLAAALGTLSTTPIDRPLPDGKKSLHTRTHEPPQSPRVLLPLQPAPVPPPLLGLPPTEAGRDVDSPASRLSSLLLVLPPPRRHWRMCAACCRRARPVRWY
jgi:hypothetical protein